MVFATVAYVLKTWANITDPLIFFPACLEKNACLKNPGTYQWCSQCFQPFGLHLFSCFEEYSFALICWEIIFVFMNCFPASLLLLHGLLNGVYTTNNNRLHATDSNFICNNRLLNVRVRDGVVLQQSTDQGWGSLSEFPPSHNLPVLHIYQNTGLYFVIADSSPITCWLASRALRALGARQYVIGLCWQLHKFI